MIKLIFYILGLFSRFNFFACQYPNTYLHARAILSEGKWQEEQLCDGGFVIGFISQIFDETDNRGLNGLLLECDNSKVIGYKPKECPRGVWGNATSYCGTVNNPLKAIGFKLKKGYFTIFDDKTGANGIKLLCEDFSELQNIESSEGEWWEEPYLMCPFSFYICGIQIQHDDGLFDKSGINEVKMTCCHLNKSISYNFNKTIFDSIDYIKGGEIVISTPEVTNWGDWYPWENCDRGFVYGFVTQVKLDGNSRGLTGVQFNCTNGRVIGFEPDDCYWKGEWDEMVSYCGSPEYPKKIKGFYVRIEPEQGFLNDDSSTNALRLICEGDTTIRSLEGARGYWFKKILCPINHFVCGLRVQYDKDRDPTGINNIDMKCCEYKFLNNSTLYNYMELTQ